MLSSILSKPIIGT